MPDVSALWQAARETLAEVDAWIEGYDSDRHRQFASHNNCPDGCFCEDCTAYRVEKGA